MKDFEAKFEEWWEVIEAYFTKELEKNMAQHRTYERILRYKLKDYQKNFPKFICGSPTSVEVLGQNENNEVASNGTTQEEKMHTKEPQDFRSGVAQEEEVQLEKPHDLRKGGQEEKEPQII